MPIETVARARYQWWEEGHPAGSEAFELEFDQAGALARVERKTEDGRVFAATARFDPSWRLLTLEAAARGAAGELSARYGWDGDAWVGRLSSPGEVALPMTSELDPTCPTALFDLVFLKRAALPPLSQRRIELLRVRMDTLETEQAHQIVERLPDSQIASEGAPVAAQHFRVTDELGRQDLLWVRDDGVCLRRTRADGAHERYRLVL